MEKNDVENTSEYGNEIIKACRRVGRTDALSQEERYEKTSFSNYGSRHGEPVWWSETD